MDILLIEDGIYDLLLEVIKRCNPNYQVGAIPIEFQNHQDIIHPERESVKPLVYISEDDQKEIENLMFPETLNRRKQLTKEDLYRCPLSYNNSQYISKRKREVSHNHPELVGTLDKCKYVLDCDANDMGVLNDPNVAVLERDWFRPQLNSGLIKYNEEIAIIASLKYDGVSVEADVSQIVESARTRGDTGIDKAADITPILGGYRFPNAPILDKPIGMKFEAIMTNSNLQRFRELKGYDYKNCRTAIIGLFGSSDAYKYRDLITLIPLQTSLKDDYGDPIDRLVEIEFMNKYFCKDELFRYSVLSGNYTTLLYQMKRFTSESEFLRPFIPFMYDGVVFEHYGLKYRKALGRENNVNKFSMAVKFNPLCKQTIFRGFSYSIGQNGVVTPKAHYDPVEFYGTIHTKSSISSLSRFKKLDLRIGDIIDVTYRNDVMPYVSKPDNNHNFINHQKDMVKEEMFPTHCPYCNNELVKSKSGDSIYCLNPSCSGKTIKRMANMLDKLNISDVGEERISLLKDIRSMRDLFEASEEDLSIIGPTNAFKLKTQLNEIKNNPIPDYMIIGALGFSDLALKTWKLIFSHTTLIELINNIKNNNLSNFLLGIKGIGPSTINTITNEFKYFEDDIDYILHTFHIIDTKYSAKPDKIIRFTGFRDKELVSILTEMGYDADDNAGVTKNTTALLIPYSGYNEGNKIKKAMKYGIPIIPVQDFKENLNL